MISALAWLILAIFGLIIVCIIHPIKFNLRSGKKLELDYAFAPILGILLLFILGIVPGKTLIAGIVGTETIKPYSILILFFALAFLCIALDLTGFFAFLALRAAKNSGGSGVRLFNAFYLLSSFLTMFTYK